jgi:hypothetical protein
MVLGRISDIKGRKSKRNISVRGVASGERRKTRRTWHPGSKRLL